MILVLKVLAHAENDLFLILIEFDDLQRKLMPFGKALARSLQPVDSQLRQRHEPIDFVDERDDNAALEDPRDRASHLDAYCVLVGEARPGVFKGILVAERDAAALDVDFGDDYGDYVALFEHFAGLANALSPRHIRNVH